MVTLWPTTQSRLVPPAVFCECRKVPWCMSSGEQGWKSCLKACNCHRSTKQAEWMSGFPTANVTLHSFCLQIQSAYIYFYLNIHCVDSNFVRDKILQSEPVSSKRMHFICRSPPSSIIFSASHHLGLHQAKLSEWIVQRQGNLSAWYCNITVQNDKLAGLIDYLFSLNIDYQWLMLAGTFLFTVQVAICLHSALAGIFKLTVQSHEFSCFGTDWQLHSNGTSKLCVHFTKAISYLRHSEIPGANGGVFTKAPAFTAPGMPPQGSPTFCEGFLNAVSQHAAPLPKAQRCWPRHRQPGKDPEEEQRRVSENSSFLQDPFTQDQWARW